MMNTICDSSSGGRDFAFGAQPLLFASLSLLLLTASASGAQGALEQGTLEPGASETGSSPNLALGHVRFHQKISATAGGFTGILADSDNFGQAITPLGDLDSDGIMDR